MAGKDRPGTYQPPLPGVKNIVDPYRPVRERSARERPGGETPALLLFVQRSGNEDFVQHFEVVYYICAPVGFYWVPLAGTHGTLAQIDYRVANF